MSESVLFVCAQNVCRSPLMSAAFEDEWSAVGNSSSRDTDWVISSAGTQAAPHKRACGYAVEIVKAVAGHRSTRLEGERLDSADLVIAASLAERSLIVQLRPSVRSRTFTLREALLLGERRISASSLVEYAEALDSRRGTLDLPNRREMPWRRNVAHPFDVIDVHQLRVGVHRKGLKRAASDARLFASRVQRDLAPRT